MQGSGVQIAMHYVASNPEKFMENFYLKSKRSIEKPHNEGPAAYVFPGDDPRPGQVARLLTLLQQQGVEIHRANQEIKLDKQTFPQGSYIIRMDQPYSRMADMMLDTQYFNIDDPRPYDDVGWTMGPLYNVKTDRVDDIKLLEEPMILVKNIVVLGGVKKLKGSAVKAYLINHNADNPLAAFRFKHTGLKMHSAEKEFEIEKTKFNAGTFIIKTDENSDDLKAVLESAGNTYGFTAWSVDTLPDVPMHPVSVPRIALMHTWQNTQNEGWVRIALDELQIPYDYISVHEVRDNEHLRDQYDVILFGPSSSSALSIVEGVTGDKPMPWEKTEITPNLGCQDSTDDMRGGLDLEGVLHLRDFIKAGGLFITLTNSSSLPIHFGLAQNVNIKETEELWARGGVFQAEIADSASPIAYGYDKELGVYFNSSPVFALGRMGGFRYPYFDSGSRDRVSGRGSKSDPDIPQGRPRDLGKETMEEFRKQQKEKGEEEEEESPYGRGGGFSGEQPRTIVRFIRDEKNLLISGGLAGGSELAGSPAVVDCKLGEGHVVLFSINPMWRHQTHGSYSLVLNAMLHYDHLDAGKK